MIDRKRNASRALPGIQGRWSGWLQPSTRSPTARVVTFSLCDEPTSGFRFEPGRGIENYLQQLDEALDRARLGAAILIGVSYSGPIAAEYAARRPERVRGLVLVSALPPDWVPNRRARFYLRAPRLLSPLFLLDSPARVLPEIRASIPQFGPAVRFMAGQLHRTSRAFVSPSRMAARLRWNEAYQFADPSAVSQPVLVITGEDGLDRVVSPHLTRRYLAALPDARHAVLPRTGHIGLLTRPAEFAELVRQFVDETLQRSFKPGTLLEGPGRGGASLVTEPLREIAGPAGPLETLLDLPAGEPHAPLPSSATLTRCTAGRCTQGCVSVVRKRSRRLASRCCGSTFAASDAAPARTTAGPARWTTIAPHSISWPSGFQRAAVGRWLPRSDRGSRGNAGLTTRVRRAARHRAARGSLRLRSRAVEPTGEVRDSRRARRAHLDSRHPEVLCRTVRAEELVVIEDATHLFEGKTAEVGEAVEDLLGDFDEQISSRTERNEGAEGEGSEV
jgi:pimeloyl-ACP methyl ester carboxylesterase